jgi:hypothetical protein
MRAFDLGADPSGERAKRQRNGRDDDSGATEAAWVECCGGEHHDDADGGVGGLAAREVEGFLDADARGGGGRCGHREEDAERKQDGGDDQQRAIVGAQAIVSRAETIGDGRVHFFAPALAPLAFGASFSAATNVLN